MTPRPLPPRPSRSSRRSDNGGIAPEPTPEPEPEALVAPALDPIADKRAKKTLAQRLRRAAAKAAVQWRGDPELTAAAGAE